MKTIILSLSLLLILFSYTKAQLLPQDCSESGILMNHTPECNDHDFVLVFEDNFDGNSLDLTKWWTPTGVTRNFNLIDVKVWYKPENVTVNNGTLKIKADKLSSPEVHTFLTDQNTTTTAVFSYTSGELKTFQKFYHGKFEIRCKLPAGQGLFPAFWTHDGLNQSEIDIFDNKQNVEQLIMATGFDFDEDGSANGCGDIVGDSPFETIPDLTDWHVYTCIFDNDFIEWQVDGVPYFSYARFHNSSGDALYCGDEFELGQYFQKKAYPLDKMIMIMNLAVLNGEDMPDETTIFPAFYEVDYVRFYKRTPCDGCVNNIVYENIENLPSATRTQEYIYTQNNTKIVAGQNVVLKSPIIKLLPGTKVEYGSTFKAIPQVCSFFNYEDATNPQFIGSSAIDNYQIVKCIDPNYYINATGVTEYTISIYNLAGQLVHSVSGTPISNQILVWNTSNTLEQWYTVHQELLNCTVDDPLVTDYNILVLDCRSIFESNNISTPYSQNENSLSKSIDQSNQTKRPDVEEEFLVYPNPASDQLNINYSGFQESSVTFSIYDVSGKEVFILNNNINSNTTSSSLNISSLSSGSYTIVADINGTLIRKRLVVSK